jgi:hypothetical protein
VFVPDARFARPEILASTNRSTAGEPRLGVGAEEGDAAEAFTYSQRAGWSRMPRWFRGDERLNALLDCIGGPLFIAAGIVVGSLV